MIYLELFWIFFRLGLISFGGVFGVLPYLQRMIVDQHGWLTAEQFLQAYVVGQFVPGPNMSMCPLIGYRIAGWGGWLAAFAGIYSGPLAVITLAFRAYHRNRERDWVRRAEISLRPLVFALLLSAVLRFVVQQARDELVPVLLIGAPLLILQRRTRLGALGMIFATGLCWWAYWRLSRP